MKKIISVSIAIIMILSLTLSAFSAEVTLGDIDANGKVTAADARSVLRVSAQLDTFNEVQFAAADIDDNGTITASDARKILRVAAELDTFAENDVKPDTEIPEPLQALYDGKYKISTVESGDYGTYTTTIAMADGVACFREEVIYDDISSAYGCILGSDGTFFEYCEPDMIAGIVDKEFIDEWEWTMPSLSELLRQSALRNRNTRFRLTT